MGSVWCGVEVGSQCLRQSEVPIIGESGFGEDGLRAARLAGR